MTLKDIFYKIRHRDIYKALDPELSILICFIEKTTLSLLTLKRFFIY